MRVRVFRSGKATDTDRSKLWNVQHGFGPGRTDQLGEVESIVLSMPVLVVNKEERKHFEARGAGTHAWVEGEIVSYKGKLNALAKVTGKMPPEERLTDPVSWYYDLKAGEYKAVPPNLALLIFDGTKLLARAWKTE